MFSNGCNQWKVSQCKENNVVLTAKFLFTLCEELVQRLPQNTKLIQKLRCFSSIILLSVIPPKFKGLFLELLGNIIYLFYTNLFIYKFRFSWWFSDDDVDVEIIETRWNKLLTLNYSDICSTQLIEKKDSTSFWVDVYNIKNSCELFMIWHFSPTMSFYTIGECTCRKGVQCNECCKTQA